jgi:hypothetical protein
VLEPPVLHEDFVLCQDSTPVPSFLPLHGSHRVQENQSVRFLPNASNWG